MVLCMYMIWYYDYDNNNLILLANVLALLGTGDKTELLSCTYIVTLLYGSSNSDYHM